MVRTARVGRAPYTPGRSPPPRAKAQLDLTGRRLQGRVAGRSLPHRRLPAKLEPASHCLPVTLLLILAGRYTVLSTFQQQRKS